MGSGLGVLLVSRRTGSGVVLPHSICALLFALMESLHPEAWEAPSQGLLMECWYWRWTKGIWRSKSDTLSARPSSPRAWSVCARVCVPTPRAFFSAAPGLCCPKPTQTWLWGAAVLYNGRGSLFGVRRALPPLKSLWVPLHRMGMVWWMHLAGGGIVLMPTVLWWGLFLNDGGTLSSWLGQGWLQ